jgi:hypothetical protein
MALAASGTIQDKPGDGGGKFSIGHLQRLRIADVEIATDQQGGASHRRQSPRKDRSR